MIYTEKIRKAVRFATKTHEVYQKQKRKGKDVAYISHPLTVGLILAAAGAEEDIVVAGILHDTVEDSQAPKKVTPEMLAERFGQAVSELVMSVTEKDKALPWAERKAATIGHIASFSEGAVLVKSADVLNNTTELLDDYRREGENVFARFNAPKEENIGNKMNLIAALLTRWPQSPLAGDLKKLAEEIDSLPAACPFRRRGDGDRS